MHRKSVNRRKPGAPATFSGAVGILTASSNINEQIAPEYGASLEHLSRSNRINGLRFLIFLTDFGARSFARDAEHAVEDKEPTTNKKVRVSPCIKKKKKQHSMFSSSCFFFFFKYTL